MELINERDLLKFKLKMYIDKLFDIYISSKDIEKKNIEINLILSELKKIVNEDVEDFCDKMRKT